MNQANFEDFKCVIVDQMFKVHNVPGDGNSFFHCLSLALHNNMRMFSTYRKDICDYIVENWDFF